MTDGRFIRIPHDLVSRIEATAEAHQLKFAAMVHYLLRTGMATNFKAEDRPIPFELMGIETYKLYRYKFDSLKGELEDLKTEIDEMEIPSEALRLSKRWIDWYNEYNKLLDTYIASMAE